MSVQHDLRELVMTEHLPDCNTCPSYRPGPCRLTLRLLFLKIADGLHPVLLQHDMHACLKCSSGAQNAA